MKVLKTLMFKVLLSSLSFCLDTINKKFEQEFLISIPNNLRQLIIDFPQNSIGTYQRGALINTTTWERLCKTIQEQNKLKIFKINSFQTLSNNVLLSLEIQKHSLVHIEFKNIRFNNILKVASFKLKELSIICNKWNAGDTSLMVKYFGTSLQRLLVEPLTINLIENISMYCPNLIYLKLGIYSCTNLSVLAYFKNLKTKMLSITIFHDIDKFFINLANNIPINVSKISICIRPFK
ncbi:3523_t:CDS:2 [Rhizophagus irregularis]|nr:3523_t:CDS:2 [Rhizophagus irregularis]